MAHEASKPSGDGGKGSARRNEDTQKVLEGYNRIFGESKLDRLLREEATARKGEERSADTVLTLKEEKEAMNDIHDEDFEDDEIQDCDWCNGTGEGRYDGDSCPKCKGKGVIFYKDEQDDY